MARHRRVLWWAHSAYALALGAFVATFAERGLAHARTVAATLVAAWLLLVVFFRAFGSGRDQVRVDETAPSARARFFVMSYVLKNLYQGMLFFLLPFYVKAATLDSLNVAFAALLLVAAVLSTLDVVFDRFFLRHHALASIFHSVALFGSLNLIVPAIVPSARTETALVVAAAASLIAFFTLHVPFRDLKRPPMLAATLVGIVAGTGNLYVARRAIPPVPLQLLRGGVGTVLTADGTLALEAARANVSVARELVATSDVRVGTEDATGAGKVDRLEHVWRHGALAIRRPTVATALGDGTHRLTSHLTSHVEGPSDAPSSALAPPSASAPPDPLAAAEGLDGRWTVDVETPAGQLVGRIRFRLVR